MAQSVTRFVAPGCCVWQKKSCTSQSLKKIANLRDPLFLPLLAERDTRRPQMLVLASACGTHERKSREASVFLSPCLVFILLVLAACSIRHDV